MNHVNPKKQTQTLKKIILAFSGGLDTSAIIPWLIETYQAEVIAYCSDLGNAPDENHLRKWALQLGAVDFIFEDVKAEFVSRFAFQAVRAGATYQDDYLLGTSLGRPLIAERMAYWAQKLGADAVAHGCTGKGNDQLRFERSWAYLIPEAKVIAPWRIWDFKGRSDLIQYLQQKGIEMVAHEKRFSEDVNLFHRSCEGGILEDPGQEFKTEDVYQWVKPLAQAETHPTKVMIHFEQGIAVAVNEKPLAPVQLLTMLNQLAGKYGIGVQDIVEERANGIKSRGIYETPGGYLLHAALKNLKHLCWDRSLLSTARFLGGQYGECLYDGFFHSDQREALEAFFVQAASTLTGSVEMKLEKGTLIFTGRFSPYSLYDNQTVTFEADEMGIHHQAEGYCKIIAIKQRQQGKRHLKKGSK